MKKFCLLILLMTSFLTFQGCSFLFGEDESEDYVSMFNFLWKDFDETYALFDVRGVDWNVQYAKVRPLVTNNMTDLEFLAALKALLYPLKDSHVYVKSTVGSLNSGEGNAELDVFSLEKVCESYVASPLKCGNNIITFGRIKSDDKIGYIHIASFSNGLTGINQKQDWASDIDIALAALQDTKCLILDVRGNRGGLTGNVTRISGRFCMVNKTYALSRTKNGSGRNDFGKAVELEIRKNGKWQYTKPVFLLTNAQTMSAGEEFTMALASQPHVTQIGNHTCGVFSLALERCMANGWRYSVSVQKVAFPDGTTPEGKGIVPNSENLIVNSSADEDAQLLRAIEKCGEC